MTILGFVLADLRRMWAGSLVIVLLIGLAASLGIAVSLQERALRLGSARAAQRFDLVVGAAGSETQLVLSAIFLQASPLPLVSGRVLDQLQKDPRSAWVAPVGFGDFFDGMPIVGTSAALATDGGRMPLREGRNLERLTDAVIGARAPLHLGDTVKPMHGLPEEGGHTHTELAYQVVGRMAPTGTPWDRAILVPIEAVWRLHGMHDEDHQKEGPDEHAAEHAEPAEPDHIGPPWNPFAPGVPAVIVKPKTVADAYRLRQDYRKETTLGVFPAEVLTRLYATLGDAQAVLTAVALGTQALVGASVILVAVVHLAQRRRQLGALRAFGAPRWALFTIVWLELLILVGLGSVLGTGIGFLAARVASNAFTVRTGIALPMSFEPGDLLLAGLLFLAVGVMAVLPAWLAYRQPAAAALRA